MSVSQGHHWLSDIIAGWWRNLSRKAEASADAEEARVAKLERAAKELGLTSDEVLSISIRAYYTSDLLPLRMSLLCLNAEGTERRDPGLFRALETSCKLCDVKGQCASDIVQDPANPRWQQYCPNAVTLRALQSRATLSGP